GVGPSPNQRQAGGPIFSVDSGAHGDKIRLRQNACARGELRPGYFSTNRTRCHADFLIVADPLELPQVSSGHYIEEVIGLAKPDGSRHRCPALSECSQANVFLTADLFW